jgi:sporulation lipoprotein, YhcN/YlaJ family
MKRILCMAIALFLLSGCSGIRDGAKNLEKTGAVKTRYEEMKNTGNVPNVDRKSSEAISRHLADLAASVPGVKGATAVALGRYAVVGIDVDADMERSQVGTIKYSVSEALKDDPYGANAIVVADPDITARLKEMRDDINAGKPVQGILEELADIVARLMPEVPNDLIKTDENAEKAVEEKEKDLNQRERNQLKQNRQNQSGSQNERQSP